MKRIHAFGAGMDSSNGIDACGMEYLYAFGAGMDSSNGIDACGMEYLLRMELL